MHESKEKEHREKRIFSFLGKRKRRKKEKRNKEEKVLKMERKRRKNVVQEDFPFQEGK